VLTIRAQNHGASVGGAGLAKSELLVGKVNGQSPGRAAVQRARDTSILDDAEC